MEYLMKSLKSHLEVAQVFSRRSKAKRLKVGAVLVRDDRIISTGWNGMPAGGSNECEYMVDKVVHTKPEVIHAEANVISFAARHGVPTEGCSLVITHSPCFECSKLIIQSGIKEVWYEEEYRIKEAVKFLTDNNVKVEKI